MLLAIPTVTIVLLIVTAVIIGVTILLYFLGKKAEKKRDEQDAQLAAAAQQVSMLIIDKKMMKIKDAGLPDAVLAQTPWYAKRAKLPIVKAKVGPQTLNLICDTAIFDDVPVKKEVKAMVSGLYITSVRGLHGKKTAPEDQKKKKGLRAWYNRQMKEQRAAKNDK